MKYILDVKWIDGGGYEEEYNTIEELYKELEDMKQHEECDFLYRIYEQKALCEWELVRGIGEQL